MLNKFYIILLLVIGLSACSSTAVTRDTTTNDVNFQSKGEARELVVTTLKNIRAQKGYMIKFNTLTDIPKSDSLKMDGEVVVVNPDTLYVRFTGSGGQKRKVARKGVKILMEHPLLGEWLDPSDMGEGGVGNGFQNPENLLKIVEKHLENVKLTSNEKNGNKNYNVVELDFEGAEVRNVLAEQSIDVDSVRWDDSKLSAKLWISKDDGMLYKIAIEATLVSTKEGIIGDEIKYHAQAEVVSYNKDLELKDIPQNVKKLLGIQ